MSRKHTRSAPARPDAPSSPAVTAQATQAGGASRRGLILGAGAAALAAVGAGAYFAFRSPASDAVRPGLDSRHAPTLGDPQARVHIVEFLDPACETCALFFPMVKRLLADNPGRIRLSVRHLPFHRGSEDVVRILEASRKQDKYWPTLETLLASQGFWAANHTAKPDLAMQVLDGLGLNPVQLLADMRTPEVDQRMAQDSRDGVLLKVDKTPEYFVNGRQMASFGRQQLQDLIQDALKRAY